MTMREKLIEVAQRVLDYDCQSGVVGVTNWPAVIDAILTTLREPDEETVEEGEWVSGNGLPATLHAYQAMIDHIREGK